MCSTVVEPCACASRVPQVLHPAVSSVVYLSDGGDPTIVLEEGLSSPLSAKKAHLVHPRERAFLAFDGELLHGVLPGPFNAAPEKAAAQRGGPKASRQAATPAPEAAAQRLVLLIAWYTEPTRTAGGKRAKLRAQSSVPRPSRSQTWPRDLELRPNERALEPAGGASKGGGAARRVAVPSASPAWSAVPPLASSERKRKGQAEGESGGAALSVRQHFFLHSAGEVGERLRAEHGIGGSWSAAEPPPGPPAGGAKEGKRGRRG